MQLKVLYISTEFPSAGINAAQVRANAVIPRLARRTDLQVASFASEATVAAEGFNILQLHQHKITLVDAALTTLSGTLRAFRRFDRPDNRRALASRLETFRPDVVHFDMIASLSFYDLVKRHAPDAKIVAHVHDAVSHLYARRISVASGPARLDLALQKRLISRIERKLLPKCDLVLVDSIEDATYLEQVGKRANVKLLPLGFDTASFTSDGAKENLCAPSIVYSGSMAGDQSQDGARFLVRDIMPKVWAEQPEAHLYIVGANPPKDIRDLANSRITVTGFVEDLGAYLRAASVYACPLRIGSGMRTRVVEALACGAPVTATPMALRGLTRPSDCSVPWLAADDPDKLATHICAILSGNHSELGLRGAAYAKAHYSWDAVVDQLIDHYSETVGSAL